MPEGPTGTGRTGDEARGGFSSTQWTVVLAAGSGSAVRRDALEKLCSSYWLPIYGYLRRRGSSPEDAEDLTQGFFATIIEGDFLDRPDPAKGRFRGYLVGALRHFIADHFEREGAIKRGGGARFINWADIDAEREYAAIGPPRQDPSECYETGWALALLSRALRRLEEEQAAAGRGAQLAVLRPFLSAAPGPGDYDRVARELGTTRTNVAVWVHRLTQRYGELVRLEVAATVQDPSDVKEEMEHLLRVLRR